jgi:prevent-host-death family protein
MKTIAAGAFKARCLSLMDEVKKKRQPLLITKHGKPVAKLVPVEGTEADPIFGFYKGKVTITGDIVAPLPPEEWGDLY